MGARRDRTPLDRGLHPRPIRAGRRPQPRRGLKRQYERGDITLDEFENLVEIHLDDRAPETRERLERIDGIGPETSATIVRRFRTLDELRDASREEIKDVHGVGPSTSLAIKREL